MQEIALASLVMAVPFAGVLLFIARRLDRDRPSAVASGLIYTAATLVGVTIACLLLGALEGSRRGLPATLLFVAALGLSALLVLFGRYLLSRSWRIANIDEQSTSARQGTGPTDDPVLGLFAWCFLLTPLGFIAGFPAMALMVLFYAFHVWLRWRRQKQAGLLSILETVAILNRPIGSVFRIDQSIANSEERSLGVRIFTNKLSGKILYKLFGSFFKNWRRQLGKFALNVEAGLPLSDAADFARVISPQDVTLLRAAELADAVERELPRLADNSTSRARKSWQPNGMLAVCLYLQLLATVYFLVVGFLMYWIVPKFKAIFGDFDIELPSVTVFLIQSADEFANAFPFWVGVLASWLAAILGAAFAGVTGTGSMPGWLLEFGPRRWSSPTVFRAMAMFLESGQALGEPLKELGRRANNTFWWQRWTEIGDLTENYPQPAEALRQSGDLEQKRVAGMAAAAMTGGQAGPAQASFLRAIATAEEQRTKRRFTALAGWLSGGLFLLMSVVALISTVGLFICIVKLINELS